MLCSIADTKRRDALQTNIDVRKNKYKAQKTKQPALSYFFFFFSWVRVSLLLEFPLDPVSVRAGWHLSRTASAFFFLGRGLGLPFLPGGFDSRRDTDEILLRDAVLDTFQHFLNSRDVVGVGLVVAEPMEPPSPLLILEAFHDRVVQRDLQRLEGFPVRLGDVHLPPGLVFVGVEHDKQMANGHGVVVRVGLGDAVGLVVRVRFEEGKLETHAEVDGVLGGGLPFEDVLVRADAVGGAATGEDEAVVAVDFLDFGDDLAEHHLDAVAELRGFVLDRERAVFFLFWEFLVERVVRLEHLLLEIRQPLVQRPVHELLPVQH